MRSELKKEKEKKVCEIDTKFAEDIRTCLDKLDDSANALDFYVRRKIHWLSDKTYLSQ